MATLASLYVEFRASTEKFAEDMAKVSKEVKELDKTLKPIKDRANDIGKVLTAGITVPLVALGTAAVASAIKMDAAMDDIRSATGATGKALEDLGTDFRTVLGEVPNSINDVSKAVSQLQQRTGATGKSLQDLAVQELNLSRITHTDLGANIAATTRLFGDWSITTDKQSAALDTMFKTSQQTGIQLTRLNELVVQFGAPMRAFGFSLEQAAALMGKWEKEGVNLETVLSGMRVALANFAKAGLEPKAALEQTIKAIKAAKTESEATGIAFQVFGKRAAVDMSRAIIEGRFNIDDLVQSIQNSHETINKAAEDTLSFADKLERLRNKAALALEPLGKQMLDVLERLMPAFEDVLKIVLDLGTAFSKLGPATQIAIFGIGALAALVGPLLLAFASVSGTITGLITLLGSLGIPAGAAATAILGVASALGAGLLGAAIGIAIGQFVNLILELTGTQGAFDKLLAAVVNTIPGIGKFITGMAATQQAAESANFTNKKFAERLTALGISFDATRLSDDKYRIGLIQLVRQHDEAAKSTNAVATAAGNAGKATTGTAKATDDLKKAAAAAGLDMAKFNALLTGTNTEGNKAANAVTQLINTFQSSLKPADDLNKDLAILTNHFSEQEIIQVWGKRIAEAADAQRKNGFEVTGLTAKLEDQSKAFLKTSAAADNFTKALEHARDVARQLPLQEMNADLIQLQESLNKGIPELPKLPTVGIPVKIDTKNMDFGEVVELSGKTADAAKEIGNLSERIRQLQAANIPASRIMAVYGSEIDKAADDAKKFGLALPENIKQLDRMGEAAKRSQEDAKKWGQVWAQTLGTITANFAKAAADTTFKAIFGDPKEKQARKEAINDLFSLGLTAEQASRTVSAIGHAVSAIGGDASTVTTLKNAFGDMAKTGKVTADQLDQLVKGGIQGYQLLAHGLGITTEQLEQQLKGGLINAQQAVFLITREMEEKFGGTLKRMARALGGFFKGILMDLAHSATEIFFAQLFSPLTAIFEKFGKALGDALQKHVIDKITGLFADKGIEKLLGNVGNLTGLGTKAVGAAGDFGPTLTQLGIGSGANIATNMPGAPVVLNAVGGAGGAAGSAGSAGGGILSSVGGLAGTVNMVSGIASAAGSIVGAIGTMRLEGTMNAVEKNTRYSEIHLSVIIDQLLWPMKFATDNLYTINYYAQYVAERIDALIDAVKGITLKAAATIPKMATGGTILGEGLIYAHAGETIVPQSMNISSEAFNAGDVINNSQTVMNRSINNVSNRNVLSSSISTISNALSSMRFEGISEAIAKNTEVLAGRMDALINVVRGITMKAADAIPKMQMGGMVTSEGLIYAHAGETIIPQSWNNQNSNVHVDVGGIHITATGDDMANPDVFAKKIMHRLDREIMTGNGGYTGKWGKRYSQNRGNITTSPVRGR